jgi:hypothetical protein
VAKLEQLSGVVQQVEPEELERLEEVLDVAELVEQSSEN